MRPFELNPYFASLESLKGIGARLLPLYTRLLSRDTNAARIVDALFHLPHSAIKRTVYASIAECPYDTPITVKGRVVEHQPPPRNRPSMPYRVLVEDLSGDISLVFFRANKAYVEKTLPKGEERLISGVIELWNGHRQMMHPDRISSLNQNIHEPSQSIDNNIELTYGLTAGLTSRGVSKVIQMALTKITSLPEWLDPAWQVKSRFPAFKEALEALHRPVDAQSIQPDALVMHPARQRLAYDELLASQLALHLMRARVRQAPQRIVRPTHPTGALRNALIDALPYTLTTAQQNAIADIVRDLSAPQPMLRLVQGDVGSGKTAVALLAMVAAIEQGRQAAFMAPTDILARQHYERIAPLALIIGLRVDVLTGRDKGKSREAILAKLEAGDTDLIIGTHALFQDGVNFANLGLAVIDEQHRFGVHQRLKLGSKGGGVDTLVMTATPIPRTLALACFGDMDISVLDEKPAGRQPIVTRVIPLERLSEVIDALHRALAKGARVYWVCPLVDESDVLDLAAASQRYDELKPIFGDDVGLIHGKMNGKDKDDAMSRFANGATKILIATTVIEVGVDVPEATVMVIEHAERFGLAQLHQLRGRIGRGKDASTCLLLYKAPLGEVAKKRLEILRDSEDGFRIAEEDLRLRGEGEILGTKQSGVPDFRLARPEHDTELLNAARDDARLIMARDPDLQTERGKALRILLYLFERDAAVRLLKAG
jgi:ATP-dependent DNA helicase RecG